MNVESSQNLYRIFIEHRIEQGSFIFQDYLRKISSGRV